MPLQRESFLKEKGKAMADHTYEEDMQELTALIDQIGDENCPVDQLEKKVKRAADLLKSLRERLQSTETRVREVLADLDDAPEDQDQ